MPYKLGTIVKKIKEDFGTADVASDIHDPQDFISTSNKTVDLMLGNGVAFGYIVEWAGLSQSGKTLMLQKMLANAQEKYDAIGIWADRENAFTNRRAEELGINVNQTIVVKPNSIPTVGELEAFLLGTITGIRKKYEDAYIFCAVDSISSFASTQKGEDMGRKAKQLHSLFRQIIPLVDSRTSFHMANQVTFMPGVMFGDTKTTTGGEAPKYYTTYRLGLENKRAIRDENKEVIGQWIEFYVTKTRMGPSDRKVTIPFFYKEGIPELGGYVRMLVDRGIIKPKNKAEFKSFKQKTVLYKDKQYHEDKPEKILKDHPELNFEEWPVRRGK